MYFKKIIIAIIRQTCLILFTNTSHRTHFHAYARQLTAIGQPKRNYVNDDRRRRFFVHKRNPGLSLRVVQGSFRKNSNDSWISDRVTVAVCFHSPFLNPEKDMRFGLSDDKILEYNSIY